MSESNEERIAELDQSRLQRQTDDMESRSFQAAVNAAYEPPARSINETMKQESAPTEPILRYFKYDHLPQHLQMISAPFAMLAEHTIMKLPRSAERTVALRKLLESKDAAVRAALPE
jgi:hypothetical protein